MQIVFACDGNYEITRLSLNLSLIRNESILDLNLINGVSYSPITLLQTFMSTIFTGANLRFLFQNVARNRTFSKILNSLIWLGTELVTKALK